MKEPVSSSLQFVLWRLGTCRRECVAGIDLQPTGLSHSIDPFYVPTTVARPSAGQLAIGFVEGAPIVHDILERATAAPETIIEAVAAAFRAAFGDAPLRSPLQAIVVTARRPAE